MKKYCLVDGDIEKARYYFCWKELSAGIGMMNKWMDGYKPITFNSRKEAKAFIEKNEINIYNKITTKIVDAEKLQMCIIERKLRESL